MNRCSTLRTCLAIALALAACPILATPQCSVATGAQLSFGTIPALASAGDRTTDSGTSFWINCNSEVAAAPHLYSSSPRTLAAGASSLPFKLSLLSAGNADLPASSPGTALGTTRNGTSQTVSLYGKIRAADYKSLPPGMYSTSISLTIEY
jgi:spore coat protein U-like protein